jgi:hypothetical protein
LNVEAAVRLEAASGIFAPEGGRTEASRVDSELFRQRVDEQDQSIFEFFVFG